MQNTVIVNNLDNDADWLLALQGNTYTKWGGKQSNQAFEARLSSRRVHEGERESDIRDYLSMNLEWEIAHHGGLGIRQLQFHTPVPPPVDQ